MKTLKPILLTAAVAALAPACGAVSNDGTPVTPTPTPTGNGVTIADIQQGNVTPNSVVKLEGVVVTAVRPANNGGVDFWAQDAGGGQYSGIYFFDRDSVAPAELEVGDELTVVGQYTEYQGQSDDTLSEIVPESVEVTATGRTPDVTVIAAADLDDLAASVAEPWEGVLIQIGGDVTVLNPALGYGEFSVGNGTGASINVDDYLYADAEVGRSSNETISHLAGVWHYAFNAYKLLPRGPSDLTGTVVNGGVFTVPLVQDTSAVGHPSSGTFLTIEDAVVTATYIQGTGNGARRHFFVQSGAIAGPWNGIYVYSQDVNWPASETFAPGDTIDVYGQYTEFNGLSEIVLTSSSTPSIVRKSVPSVSVTPVSLSLADLVASTEQYEGVLVQLNDASITVTKAPNQYGEFEISDGSVFLLVDDLVFPQAETGVVMGNTFSLLRGVVTYSFGSYKLLPRSAADMVKN